MNNSNLFLDPVQTVQFLSVFTYINALSDIFYSEKMISKEDMGKPFVIVDSLYEYLNKAKNETEAKIQLVQKLLQGSDLYGGNENDTLDVEYINATLNYVVGKVVFAQSGNIYGYLAEIVSLSNNLQLSAFKKHMHDRLFYLRQLNNDGTVSKLSHLAAAKIAETLLWPLFPEPPHDMKIISIKYIYAQAGLLLAHSAQMNLTDMSFRKYVTLAMTVEASVQHQQTSKSVLQIFSLPALIYYAYKEKDKFHQNTSKILIKDKEFWAETFCTLFSYLNTTFETINQKALESDSFYQFHLSMLSLKNRTAIAEDFLKKECTYHDESKFQTAVENYKTFASMTYCQYGKMLPNLDEMYSNQFPKIREKYQILQEDFIREAFNEFAKLKNLINSPHTKVFKSQAKPYNMRCNTCSPRIPIPKSNIYLFALRNFNDVIFFALEQNESNATVICLEGNQTMFNIRVGLPITSELEIPPTIKFFKRADENFDNFVQSVAEMKSNEFINQLYEYGYEKTSAEKFIDIIKAFIPFYHCVKYAKEGNQGLAALTCFMDLASFIPFLGQLSIIGLKTSTIVTNRLFLATELSIRTFTLRQAIISTLGAGLRKAVLSLHEVASKVIFTTEMFKSVSVGLLRAVDPGFEFLWKLHWHGSIFIGNILKKLSKNLGKQFPALHFKYAKFESMWQQLTKKVDKSGDSSGMTSVPVGRLDDHDVFRYVFPGGENLYGPKFIRLSNKNVELRRMIGFDTEVPVVVTRVSKNGKVFYKRVDLRTGETLGLEMKINKNNLLENGKPPFRRHIFNIVTEGLGGRGALKVKIQGSIVAAAKLVAGANIGINVNMAVQHLSHFILSIDQPLNIVEFVKDIDTEPSDFDYLKNVDVNDLLPNTIAGESYDGISIDPNVNIFQPVPTYNDLALDWIRTGRINKMYDDFFVHNVDELQILLFENRLSFDSYGEARHRIVTFYSHLSPTDKYADMSNAYKGYGRRDISKVVGFEDYHILFTWVLNEFHNIKSNPVFSMNVKKALYRVAIRQVHTSGSELPETLYYIDTKIRNLEDEDFLQLRGKTLKSNKFLMSVRKRYKIKHLIADKYHTKPYLFLYTVHLDSKYLAVHLNDVIPHYDNPILILPGITFLIGDVSRKTMFGHNVICIEVRNIPIAKELIIASSMQNINKLN